MSDRKYEALEACLQALAADVEVDALLAQYPEFSKEIRSILEAALQAQTLSTASVPEDAFQRSLASIQRHAAGMRRSEAATSRTTTLVTRLVTAVVLIFLFIVGPTGLVRASNESLPGDDLYSVKRTWEGIRLRIAGNPEQREELESVFEQERLHEVHELLNEGRNETIKFTGEVMEQSEDQWLVSGIPVRITSESQLPEDPVTIGAIVIIDGFTKSDGFVDAYRVEVVEPGIALPPLLPVEIEEFDNPNLNENTNLNSNENGEEDGGEIGAPENENGDSGGDDGGPGNENDSSDNGGDRNKGSGGGGGDDDNGGEEGDDN